MTFEFAYFFIFLLSVKMIKRDLLNESEIELELNDISEWKLEGKTIIREISATNFVAAVGILNSIAILAEINDHHPDILIYGWNKLRISLSTHDQGGLTILDFKLAKEIDNLKF